MSAVNGSGEVVDDPSLEITVALGSNPTGATLAGTLTRPTVGGLASFGDVSLTTAGQGYTLVATSPGLLPAESVPFDITPDTVSLVVLTQPSTADAAAPFSPTVQVALQDGFGNRVDGTVTAALGTDPTGGVAALTGTLSVATVDGVATFSDLAVSRAGAGYTLDFDSDTLQVSSQAFEVLPVVRSVLIVFSDNNFPGVLQGVLQGTGAFTTVDQFNAGAATPTLQDLMPYDGVCVYRNNNFLDAVALGDVLADYFDSGGQVTTALFADVQGALGPGIQGRFGSDYLFLPNSVLRDNSQFNDGLGQVNEPGSPLLLDVAAFAVPGTAFKNPGALTNGGVSVVDRANDGVPLVVRGQNKGRNRADLNFFPLPASSSSAGWTGNGAELIRNALLFR